MDQNDCSSWARICKYVEVLNTTLYLISHSVKMDIESNPGKYSIDQLDSAFKIIKGRCNEGVSEFLKESDKYMLTRNQLKAIAEKIGAKPEFLYFESTEQREFTTKTPLDNLNIENAEIEPPEDATEAGVNDGACSLAVTELASTKATQANNNDFDFSGLLNEPAKKDGWFRVIDDMTKVFFNSCGTIPNEYQAWAHLWETPPENYKISTGTDKGEVCLNMPGVRPLSRSAFSKRWLKYQPIKPNNADNGF